MPITLRGRGGATYSREVHLDCGVEDVACTEDLHDQQRVPRSELDMALGTNSTRTIPAKGDCGEVETGEEGREEEDALGAGRVRDLCYLAKTGYAIGASPYLSDGE